MKDLNIPEEEKKISKVDDMLPDEEPLTVKIELTDEGNKLIDDFTQRIEKLKFDIDLFRKTLQKFLYIS